MLNPTFEDKIFAIEQLAGLFNNAQRFVCIYTPSMDFDFWNDPNLFQAIKKFLLRHKNAYIEIIQINSDFSRSHQLVKLAKRLSNLHILQVDENEAKRLEPDSSFGYADNSGIYYQFNQRYFKGYCSSSDRSNNLRFKERYSTLKNIARPSIQFKTLMV